MRGVVAFLAALALALLGIIAEPQSQPVPLACADDETREQTRAVLLDGFAMALKDHTKHIFDIWLRDDSDQPKRAVAGMREGINAYVRARAATMKWSPPPCAAK